MQRTAESSELTKQLSKSFHAPGLALDPSLGDIHLASHRPLLMHPLLHRDVARSLHERCKTAGR